MPYEAQKATELDESALEELERLKTENLELKKRLSFYESLENYQSRDKDNRVLEKVLQASPDIIYIYSLTEQRNLFANQQIADYLGYSPQEIQSMGGEFMARVLHPDDLARLPGIYENWQKVKDHEVIEIEYRMQHKDGSWHWFQAWDKVFERETDGRVKSIIGTAHDVTAWKAAEAKLIDSIQEKEMLLREVNHRVKNNLNIILSLLFFQKDQVSQPASLQLIENIENRIFSISLVHSLAFRNQNLNSISMTDYINQMVQHIQQNQLETFENVSIEQEIQPCLIRLEQAQTCGLILMELIINASRHAFPENHQGLITVRFFQQDNFYILEVKDNGTGFKIPEEFKSGSGLFLARLLMSEPGHSLEIINDAGTHIAVRLPISA